MALAVGAGASSPQDEVEAGDAAASRAQAPSSSEPRGERLAAPGSPQVLDPLRPPLLREGSTLVEARGRLERNDRREVWQVVIDSGRADRPPHRLIILPCTRLAEVEQLLEAADGAAVTFQVTGRVYVFGGENYILPLHAPQVIAQDDPPDTSARPSAPQNPPAPANTPATPAADADEQPAGSAASEPPDDAAGSTASPADDASVEDLMRDLERAVGPLVRGRSSAVEPPPPSRSNLVREGMTLTDRRGTLRRDQFGAWLFVFDADASGLADPPMVVMPCLLLERMADYVRRTNGGPLLISGEVYAYGGENYLLPTMFRIPRNHTPLSP